MEVWAELKKILGCNLCGATVRPVKTVMESKTHAKADLCNKCWDETKDYPKFVAGLKAQEIQVWDFV